MNRQRNALLVAIVVLFFAIGAIATYSRIQFRRTHFQVGSVPQELINQLMPKTVPLESIRPPALRLGDPMRFGNVTSIVSIIEYGDFECEYCRSENLEIKRIAAAYDGKVRFVWRDMPIEEKHKEAMDAAVFARCAGQQGRYWEAFDLLMASPKLGESLYREIADKLKLEQNLLSSCRKNPALETAIRQDTSEARAEGINSVPFIFVGTKAFQGFVDAETLKKEIETSLSSL